MTKTEKFIEREGHNDLRWKTTPTPEQGRVALRVSLQKRTFLFFWSEISYDFAVNGPCDVPKSKEAILKEVNDYLNEKEYFAS